MFLDAVLYVAAVVLVAGAPLGVWSRRPPVRWRPARRLLATARHEARQRP
jgi:cytochrome c oxidase assembly factor CtaG